MPSTVTKLVGLQLILTVFGLIALGIVLKMCGYPYDPTVRWNALAVFLHEHGLWLLLFPVCWGSFAMAAERGANEQTHRITIAVGLIFACLPLLLFLYAAIFPYTRPIYIYIGKPAHSAPTSCVPNTSFPPTPVAQVK
jgi:hypothetical protein